VQRAALRLDELEDAMKLMGTIWVLMLVAAAVVAWASPPVGVTPTLIGRGTYEPFKVKSEPQSLVDVAVKAKSHVDVVVRTHDYAVGGSTGWHTHPGPVFITVLEGEVAFTSDDPTCTCTSCTKARATSTGRGTRAQRKGQPAKISPSSSRR
jgi:hypothetical protein